MKKIIVFTDGSCKNNGYRNSYGGIGIHFPNGELKDVSKIFRKGKCTNQRTELYAIIIAILYIKKFFDLHDTSIVIYTDSKYSIQSITKWVNQWKKNGWKTKNNQPVQNRELIEILDKYYSRYKIKLKHVNAHTNKTDWKSIGNQIADELAVKASKKYLQTTK
jgi:ribonuclease HI